MYDKANLIELAQGLHSLGVRLLGSGGTAKKIRDSGIPIQLERRMLFLATHLLMVSQGRCGYHEGAGDVGWPCEDIASCGSRRFVCPWRA